MKWNNRKISFDLTGYMDLGIFWNVAGILEDKCELKVMAVTSDGALTNQTMY